jgi:hypothetical protein
MAKDIYHQAVRNALENEGWTITHDPYAIELTDRKNLSVDLAAEKLIEAEKGMTKIAVEVKSFIGDSFMHDFYVAFGKYAVYRKFMAEQEPERQLFLAVDNIVYREQFTNKSIHAFCESEQVKMFIFNPKQKTIQEWIK